MKYLAGALALCLAGCAGPSYKISKFVHEGDSADHVKEAVGTPRKITEIEDGSGDKWWFYTGHGDFCGIYFKAEAVTQTKCEKNVPGMGTGMGKQFLTGLGMFMNGMGTVMKGAGNGLVNAPRQVCYITDGYGHNTYYYC